MILLLALSCFFLTIQRICCIGTLFFIALERSCKRVGLSYAECLLDCSTFFDFLSDTFSHLSSSFLGDTSLSCFEIKFFGKSDVSEGKSKLL